MNKRELIAAVAERSGMAQADAARAVGATLGVIFDTLCAGERVQLTGFGTFAVRQRKARMGRDPYTKAEIHIPASKVPFFNAGKALRQKLNSDGAFAGVEDIRGQET